MTPNVLTETRCHQTTQTQPNPHLLTMNHHSMYNIMVPQMCTYPTKTPNQCPHAQKKKLKKKKERKNTSPTKDMYTCQPLASH